MPEPLRPEDVPDELIDLFDKGSYERGSAYTGNSQFIGEQEYFRGGIAAVYDQIEKQVRAKVTAELRDAGKAIVDREALVDAISRCEVPKVRPIEGVVTVSAESLADAILALVNARGEE